MTLLICLRRCASRWNDAAMRSLKFDDLLNVARFNLETTRNTQIRQKRGSSTSETLYLRNN